jgi:hypothetical protein
VSPASTRTAAATGVPPPAPSRSRHQAWCTRATGTRSRRRRSDHPRRLRRPPNPPVRPGSVEPSPRNGPPSAPPIPARRPDTADTDRAARPAASTDPTATASAPHPRCADSPASGATSTPSEPDYDPPREQPETARPRAHPLARLQPFRQQPPAQTTHQPHMDPGRGERVTHPGQRRTEPVCVVRQRTNDSRSRNLRHHVLPPGRAPCHYLESPAASRNYADLGCRRLRARPAPACRSRTGALLGRHDPVLGIGSMTRTGVRPRRRVG